jgi:hypothetical protein
VALQRKAVKAELIRRPIEPTRKCRQNAKELPREGARGAQTLYMTGRMQMNKNKHATAILQALD